MVSSLVGLVGNLEVLMELAKTCGFFNLLI